MSVPAEAETECLHCKINDLVEEMLEAKLQTGDAVDVADVASRMVESLADLILTAVPPAEQSKLIAYALQEFGRLLIEKAAAGEGDTTH
jgi:hypothetical protein